MIVDAFGLSAQADRDENQDCFCADLDNGLFVVADGLGGRPAGAQASQTAVGRFVAAVASLPSERRLASDALHAAVAAANHALLEAGEINPELSGLATTMSALLVDGGSGTIVHVGDSRIYRLRGERLEQLTRDHTVAFELVMLERLTAADLPTHPLRKVLSRFIGSPNDALPDVAALRPEPGDCFLLTTDGVTAVLTDGDIQRILAPDGRTAETMCRHLIGEALQRSPPDNLTALIVLVSEP